MNSFILKFLGTHIIILLIAVGLFLPFLGLNPLFDWDEINFAESAREMLVSGNYFQVQINYEPFFEKPPLFFWMQAASMSLFGINEWSARLPNVFAGYFTFLVLFYFGSWLKDAKTGWIFIALTAASTLPHFYFRTGIIDPWFNLFIVSGILLYIIYLFEQEKFYFALASGLCIGLAVLTKGPVALLMYGLTLIFSTVFLKIKFNLKFIFFAGSACLIPLLSWYGTLTWIEGWGFLSKFIQYQIELFTQPVAGHEQGWYYHILVLLLACFPFSWLMFRSSFYTPTDYKNRLSKSVLLILFLCVLIIFSISKTKIIHYSSLTWIPGIIICGILIREQIHFPGKLKLPEWAWGISITGILAGFLIAVFGYYLPELKYHPEIIGDKFIRAGLNGPIEWTGWEFLPGIILFAGSFILLILRYFIWKNNRHFIHILISQVTITTTFLHLTAGIIVPRISEVTQGPAIQFYKGLKNKNAVVITEGYKSYAHYFYAEVKPPDRPEIKDLNWLIEGKIDRPVWMVIRTDRMNESVTDIFHNFKEVFRSGGFIFYLRNP